MTKIKLQANLYEGKELGYSQYFGENPSWYAEFKMKGHNGIDVPTSVGTKLLSCINGVVTETNNDTKGYGIYVKIENEYCGVLYAHMKDFHLKVGDKVKAGDCVGYSGNTGNSTGPHLHFGVFPIPRDRENGYAGYIDPFGDQIEWVKTLNEDAKPTLNIKIEKEINTTISVEKPTQPVFDMSSLDGNKTKIITAGIIVIAILGQQGYIDQHLMETLNLISTALIGYTLRDAIKKK